MNISAQPIRFRNLVDTFHDKQFKGFKGFVFISIILILHACTISRFYKVHLMSEKRMFEPFVTIEEPT